MLPLSVRSVKIITIGTGTRIVFARNISTMRGESWGDAVPDRMDDVKRKQPYLFGG
jgi:hypothetical protein